VCHLLNGLHGVISQKIILFMRMKCHLLNRLEVHWRLYAPNTLTLKELSIQPIQCVFCVILGINSEYFPKQHQQIDFCVFSVM
jgi:hypothetical protein